MSESREGQGVYEICYLGSGAKRQLLSLFIDQALQLSADGRLADFAPVLVDAARDVSAMEEGGVLLLGGRTADGATSLVTVRQLRRHNPHLMIYLATPDDDAVVASLTKYARAGVDRVFVLSSPSDISELVSCVAQRLLAPPPEDALRCIDGLSVGSRQQQLALHAVRNSQAKEPLDSVAARFGQALRTLEDCLAVAGLPRLRDLYRLGRFLHGEELVRRGVSKPTERAIRLGFGSESNMRHQRARLRAAFRRDERLRSFATLLPGLEDITPCPPEW